MDGHADTYLETEFSMEREWLLYVLKYLREYSERITKEKKDVDEQIAASFKMYNPDNVDQFAQALYFTKLRETLLARTKIAASSLLKPYFSRVDFQIDGEASVSKFYLGKMSVYKDGDEEPLVIDWRAPVASLYYEGRLGQGSYDSPDGVITGEISLKRQYFI